MADKPTTRPPDDLLELPTRKEWRQWLRKNHRSAKEAWLVFYRKGSGIERISYNDAVEEALCFGWIDSIVHGVDEQRFAQRFSPRRPTTPYSPTNQERLRRLIAQGKVSKRVLETIRQRTSDPRLQLKPDVLGLKSAAEPRLVVAKDILAAIKSDKEAWANYRKLSPAYKRIRIGFIEGARNRPAEFEKRLRYFIKMTAKGKMFGFGGVEKYY